MISFSKIGDSHEILSFYIDIELLKYSKYNEVIHCIEPPIYDKHIEYKWIIDNSKYKAGDWTFSDNFMNGCLGLFCTPKGTSSSSSNSPIALGCDFYKVPRDVEQLSIKLRFKTNIKHEDTYLEKEKMIQGSAYIKSGSEVRIMDPRFTVKTFMETEKIVVTVIIDISEDIQ